MKPYVYGVDIGGTTIKVGLFTSVGQLLDRWELPTRTEGCGAAILPDLVQWMLEGPVPTDQLEGVGVGVPGPVLADGTVNGCVNLGWGVLPVSETLSRRLGGLPVRDQYRASVFHGAAETEFAAAALGNDAGMYGAAQLVLRAQ